MRSKSLRARRGSRYGSLSHCCPGAGWEVTGTELNPQSATALKVHGIPLLTTELEQAPFADGTFGLVHMHHVLEHTRSPLAVLRAAHRILMPGGFLVVEVPNELRSLASVTKRFLRSREDSETTGLEHEWFFAPASLSRVLRDAGFEHARVETPYLPVAGRRVRSVLSLVASKVAAGDVIVAWARKQAG